jgi:RNA polymerase sigma factor (sigma-70 family)
MAVPDPKTLMAVVEELRARLARTLGRDEAADLAAEAVTRGLGHPPLDGRFRPWLERILRNLVADHWRRRARERCALPPVSEGPTPEEAALGHERRQVVRRSLGRLPREVRRAILLRYYLDADGPAAARRQAVSMATVRTRVHRGLSRLRVAVGKLRAFPPTWRLFPALLHPAGAALLLLAQQSPLPPPAPAPRPAAAVLPAHAPAAGQAAARLAGGVPVQHEPPPRPRRPPPAPPAAVQRFDFGDDVIDVDLQSPEGQTVVGARESPRASSLIEIRVSMVPEVVKSLEDL